MKFYLFLFCIGLHACSLKSMNSDDSGSLIMYRLERILAAQLPPEIVICIKQYVYGDLFVDFFYHEKQLLRYFEHGPDHRYTAHSPDPGSNLNKYVHAQEPSDLEKYQLLGNPTCCATDPSNTQVMLGYEDGGVLCYKQDWHLLYNRNLVNAVHAVSFLNFKRESDTSSLIPFAIASHTNHALTFLFENRDCYNQLHLSPKTTIDYMTSTQQEPFILCGVKATTIHLIYAKDWKWDSCDSENADTKHYIISLPHDMKIKGIGLWGCRIVLKTDAGYKYLTPYTDKLYDDLFVKYRYSFAQAYVMQCMINEEHISHRDKHIYNMLPQTIRTALHPLFLTNHLISNG